VPRVRITSLNAVRRNSGSPARSTCCRTTAAGWGWSLPLRRRRSSWHSPPSRHRSPAAGAAAAKVLISGWTPN
jgi:hypothetical protein